MSLILNSDVRPTQTRPSVGFGVIQTETWFWISRLRCMARTIMVFFPLIGGLIFECMGVKACFDVFVVLFIAFLYICI